MILLGDHSVGREMVPGSWQRGGPYFVASDIRGPGEEDPEVGRARGTTVRTGGGTVGATGAGNAVGIDPHKRTLTASVVDGRGGELGTRSFKVSGVGHRETGAWATSFGRSIGGAWRARPAWDGTPPCT
jgi:hypothetical protein